MGLLRILGLVLVHARIGGDIFGAIARLDRVAGGMHRLGRHVDAIGTHIGDVARLIEALGRAHGLARAHAEFAAGLLLEGRCHEGWGGVAIGGLGFHIGDAERARRYGLHRQPGLGRGRQIEAVKLAAPQMRQPRLEFLSARCLQHGAHRPVFAAAKGFDFHLAVGDDAQGHRLHPARRFRAGQLAPQHGRQVEAHQIIQRPARQIGLDQFHVDLTGVLHRFGDGGSGDRVEHHAADGHAGLDRLAAGQRLLQVP